MLLVKPHVSWFTAHNKGKDVPELAMKAHRGTRGVPPLILNLYISGR
jgi:hypothetical protein